MPLDNPSRPVVVIPAYKPSPGLIDLVRELVSRRVPRILVVDDGGGPDFAAIFEQVAAFPQVTLLRHAVNLGKGAALKTAFNHVLCSMPDAPGVVTADADGQHHPEDIERVAASLAAQPGALVLGCRQFGGEVPLRSRIGNIATRRIMHALLGRKLTDTQTGLRGIPIALLPKLLRIEATGYEFELEMLLAAHHLAIPFVEEPIRTIYEEGNKSSHFNPVIDSMKIYFVLLRFGSVSMMTALIDNLVFILAHSRGLDVLTSQILGRAVAVVFNYTMVRRSVFNSHQSHTTVLPKYLALVVASGTVSYAGIRTLGSNFGMPPVPAKLLVETLLFFVNFAVQRLLIFRNREADTAPVEVPGAGWSWRAVAAAVVFAAAAAVAVLGLATVPLFSQDIWFPIGLRRFERFTGAAMALGIPLLLMFPWAFTGLFAALVIVLSAVAIGPAPVLAVAFFLLSSCALGSKLIGAKEQATDEHLLGTLLGMGVYIFLMTWLARLPVNTPWLWAAILAVPLLIDLRGARGRLGHWARMVRGAELRDVWERAAFALVLFLLLAHWMIALKPEFSTDGLAMHLAIPMDIAAHHRLTFEPARFLWAVMPMGADWCFSIVYLLGGEYATHFLVWSMLVMLAALLFRMLMRVSCRPVAWLLTGVFLATPLVQLVTGAVFVENLQASMILGLVFAIWRFRESGGQRYFYLALALGGSAMAIKIGALAFLTPSLVFLGVEAARQWNKLGPRRWLMPLAGLLLLAASASPPYSIAYAKTGNPVFPFRNETYHSPLIPAGEDITDGRFRQPLRWSTLYDVTFHSSRYYEGQDGSLGFDYLLIVPLALLGVFAVGGAAAATGLIAFTGAILVFRSEPNARYVYSALPLFLPPAAALLNAVQPRRGVFRMIIGGLAASTLLGLYFLSTASYYHKDFCLRLPFSRAERARYVTEAAPVRDVIAFYNRMHAGTNVLLTQNATLAGIQGEVYENHWHQLSTLIALQHAATAADALQLLKSWNIQYLIAIKPGMGEKLRPSTLAKVMDLCTVPEYQQGDSYLARLDTNCDLTHIPERTPLLMTRGSYDDFDPAIVFKGDWEADEQFKEPLRQTITYTNVPGAEVRIAFDGQAVTWYFTKAPNRGIAEVAIDGVSKGTIDLYAAQVEWQSKLRFCCFQPGRHEMSIRVTGDQNPQATGRFVDLDAIVVE